MFGKDDKLKACLYCKFIWHFTKNLVMEPDIRYPVKAVSAATLPVCSKVLWIFFCYKAPVFPKNLALFGKKWKKER
jgi:hypothetical protein